MTTTNDRNVIIEFLDGSSMKLPPEVWDNLTEAYNRRASAFGVKTDKLETLIPLAAVKRAYRAAEGAQEPLRVKRAPKWR